MSWVIYINDCVVGLCDDVLVALDILAHRWTVGAVATLHSAYDVYRCRWDIRQECLCYARLRLAAASVSVMFALKGVGFRCKVVL